MIKAFIFDLDGTIADSIWDICDAFNAVLARHGLPVFSAEHYRAAVGLGARNLTERLLPPAMAADPAAVESILAEYSAEYLKAPVARTRPFAGMLETLKILAGMGLRLGVCSNKPQDACDAVAEAIFPGIFTRVRGNAPGIPHKPDPAPALAVAEALKASGRQVVFVGDSPVDMETAKNAGFIPVGVTWGYRTAEQIAAAGAERMVSDPRELIVLAEIL